MNLQLTTNPDRGRAAGARRTAWTGPRQQAGTHPGHHRRTGGPRPRTPSI